MLVVEDVFRTGTTARKVSEAVTALGGEVVGVAAMCNLGEVKAADVGNVPQLFALASLKLASWTPETCPLCARRVPVNTEMGAGKQTVMVFGD